MVTSTELNDVEALLVKVLPNPRGFLERLVEQVFERLATDLPTGVGPTVVASYDSKVHEELADQNILLAAALGACDCWGHDPDCGFCSGSGSAGWMAPDHALFDEYVEPAVVRMSATAGTDSSTPDEGHEEGTPA